MTGTIQLERESIYVFVASFELPTRLKARADAPVATILKDKRQLERQR